MSQPKSKVFKSKYDKNKLKKFIAKNPQASLYDIASHFKGSRNGVAHALKNFGIEYISRREFLTHYDETKLRAFIAANPKATLSKIATHFNGKESSVYSAIKRFKIKRESQGWNKFEENKLRAFMAAHPRATTTEIAAHFKGTPGKAHAALKRFHIQGNPKGYQPLKYDEHKLREFIAENPNSSLAEIAAHFNGSGEGVSAALERFKIKRKSAHIRNIKYPKNALKKFVAKNPTACLADVYAHFGGNRGGIDTALRRFNIKIGKTIIKPKKFDEQKLREFIEKNPKASRAQIAAHFKGSPSGVSGALKRFQIKRNDVRHHFSTQEDEQKLKEFIESYPKPSLHKIAAHFGGGISGVRSALKRFQIKRDLSEYRSLKYDEHKIREFMAANPKSSLSKMAAHFKGSHDGISYALKRLNIEHPKMKPKPQYDKNKLKEFIAKNPNVSISEIAARFNCDTNTVYLEFKRLDITNEIKQR